MNYPKRLGKFRLEAMRRMPKWRRRRQRKLIAITGCMRSGKTSHLIQMVTVRVAYAGQKAQVFSPATDTRSGVGQIAAQDGFVLPAQTVSHSSEILELVEPDTDLVAIDEAQFFDLGLIAVCQELMQQREVIVAGLSTDFRGEPFGPVPEIMAIATKTHSLTAICAICGEEAYRTQRLVNGEPAHYDDPLVIVGDFGVGTERYEARCLLHHVVLREKYESPKGQV